MSASALLGIGTKALFAAYRQVQTASNNIANANVPGYSRQQVELQTAPGESSGDGFVGRGVNVTSITRATNAFLTQQANALASASGADAARGDMLSQLEVVFGKGDTGLGYAATQIFGAYADLAAAPGDLSARQAVLGKLEDFAALARATSQRIDALQTQQQYDVKASLEEINGVAKSLAKLNGQIVNALASGHSPNDLLDQRDELVKGLARQMEVQTVGASDGSLSVFISSGESLVLGTAANEVITLPSSRDPGQLTLGVKVADKLTLLSRASAGEGRIGGLLRFQNDDLVSARNRLGQLVSVVAHSLNEQQLRGLDLGGAAGTRLFNLDAPQGTPASTNAKDGNGNFISSLGATVTDPQALMASEYDVLADPANAGQYIVTRLSDGLQRSGLVNGDEIDGFRLEDGANAPAAGERFLLEPVAMAAGSIELVLRNPQGLAAANPVTAAAAVGNVGTMSVSGLNIVAAPVAGYAPMAIRFTSAAGDFEILDANDAQLSTGTYTPGQPIAWDGMELSLSGLPKAGDRIQVTPTVHIASSNGNALSLQMLGDRRMVGGQTAAEAFASMLSDVGVRTQSARAAATNSAAALGEANGQLTGQTGVNLDEEAARLIQYQQAYQAAARVLQTGQTLLDTVIQLVN